MSFRGFFPAAGGFLYLSVSRNAPENSGIYVRSLDASPETPSTRILAAGFSAAYVPNGAGREGHLLFMRDGGLFAQAFDPARLDLSGEATQIAGPVGSFLDSAFFSASTDGTLAFRAPDKPVWLTWLDRSGNVLQRVGDPDMYSGLALTRDGTRAVVVKRAVRATVDQDLWLVDLGSGRSRKLTSDERLRAARSGPRMTNAYFSRKGGRLARSSSNPLTAIMKHACCFEASSTRFQAAVLSTEGFCCIPAKPLGRPEQTSGPWR